MVAIVPVIAEPAQVVSEHVRFLGRPLKLVEILRSSISLRRRVMGGRQLREPGVAAAIQAFERTSGLTS